MVVAVGKDEHETGSGGTQLTGSREANVGDCRPEREGTVDKARCNG